jgi:hypothetical protein
MKMEIINSATNEAKTVLMAEVYVDLTHAQVQI